MGAVRVSEALPVASGAIALKFRLLGSFEGSLGGAPIAPQAWRTRPTLSVLKILLTARGGVLSSETIADRVWPEAEGDQSRTSLKVAIRTLRGVLEPGVPAANARVLLTAPGGYRLDPQSVWLDVAEFEAACQAGAAAETREDRTAALDAYRAAADLYRGDLLADDLYADWALEERERLRALCLDTLERLAALQLRVGQQADATDVIERALALDPLREELYGLLMRTHAAAGRRAHALATYERCKARLASELGVAPAAETERIRATILSADVLPVAPSSQSFHVPFVGRERALAQLRSAWQSARSGMAPVVLVRGGPGLGKTRLAQHFVTHGTSGARVVWITAHEAEAELPYASILASVREWLTTASAGQRAMLAPYAAALAHLLPGWSAAPDRRPEAGEIMEALTRVLLLMLGQGFALLVYDDLQWLDSSTGTWLTHALRRLTPKTLPILTCRAAAQLSPWTNAILGELYRDELLVEIPLAPLTQEDVGQIAGHADLAQRLYAESQGNPLYLVELLRELHREGAVDRVPSTLPVPGGVQSAIMSRVRRLSPSAREVLSALSVIGRSAGVALVASTVGHPLPDALDELDGLMAVDLVRPSSDGQGYDVAHPLIGRAVYESLSPGRRQWWHRRVAEGLRTEGSAGHLFRHLVLGDADPDAVVEAGLSAGSAALLQHAYAESLDYFQTVLKRLEPAARDQRWEKAVNGAGEALIALGRWDEAIAYFERAMKAAATPLSKARAGRRLAHALADFGARGLQRASDLALSLEAELAEVAPSQEVGLELAQLVAVAALAEYHRGEYRRVLEDGERALQMFAGLPGVEIDEIHLTHWIAQAEQRLGMLAQANARYPALIARARALGDDFYATRLEEGLAATFSHMGRLDDAYVLDDRAVEFFHKRGLAKFEAIAVGNRGYIVERKGDLAAARQDYGDAIKLAEALRSDYTVTHWRVALGAVLIPIGDVRAANEQLQAAVTLGERIGARQPVSHAYVYLGDVEMARGRTGEAIELYRHAIAEGDAIGDSHVHREGQPRLCYALLTVGQPEAAIAAAERGLAVARAGGFVIDVAQNLTALGVACKSRSEIIEAIRILRQASSRYLLAEALARLAEVGPGAKRRALINEARALATLAGARPLLERLRTLATV